MNQKVRSYYWGESSALVNLGDLLLPMILNALGFTAVPWKVPDDEVINPGRCLLVIGSLLTRADFARIDYPLDVWGCGWKGPGTEPQGTPDVRYFAVRGPHTARQLGLPVDIPLGDPALLVPRLLAVVPQPHENPLVIPHFSRLRCLNGRDRLQQTACSEVLSPLVLRQPLRAGLPGLAGLRAALSRHLRQGIVTLDIVAAIRRIAGAPFVLTGSLHGAILAQAFGVPWACYNDGYLDAPAKWQDWGAYLGIDIEAVSTLAQGKQWWDRTGRRGRPRDLDKLLSAFPYSI